MGVGSTKSAKLAGRLTPFLVICYLFSHVDRVSPAFAAVVMAKDLGLATGDVYATTSAFFGALLIFSIPAALLMHAAGARRWISLLMIAMGLASIALALTPEIASALSGGVPAAAMNLRTVYLLRVLSGAASAGIIPCIIIYLANWSAGAERAWRIACFLVAIPLATALSPAIQSVSMLIMDSLRGFELKGWQSLLIIEAIPSILAGLLALRLLPDTPRDLTRLDAERRASLQGALDADVALRKAPVVMGAANWLGPFLCAGIWVAIALLLPKRWRPALRKLGRTWTLGMMYCGLQFGISGLFFPLVYCVRLAVTQLGLDRMINRDVSTATSWLLTILYAVAILAMLACSRGADRHGRHGRYLVVAAFVAGLSLVCAIAMRDPALIAIFVGVCMVATFAAQAVFWPLPIGFLAGVPATVGVAFIFSAGVFGAIAGPAEVGHAIPSATGFSADFALALTKFAAAYVVLALVGLAFVGGGATVAPQAGVAASAMRT